MEDFKILVYAINEEFEEEELAYTEPCPRDMKKAIGQAKKKYKTGAYGRDVTEIRITDNDGGELWTWNTKTGEQIDYSDMRREEDPEGDE